MYLSENYHEFICIEWLYKFSGDTKEVSRITNYEVPEGKTIYFRSLGQTTKVWKKKINLEERIKFWSKKYPVYGKY